MKKSILTIALAAMMLVAFTACEQQVPNVLPDDVNYITIVQTEDAVEGKAFDPSLFNVMVYSSNPNVAPVTVSGKGYVSLTDSSAKTFAPEQKVTAVYAGKTASPLAVSVAEVLDVKVEGFPESVVQNAAMLKTSTLTASVTLSNGTELELGADDYTIWYNVSAAVTGEDEEGTPVTAKVFFDIENTGTPVLSKTVANLKVTRDTSTDPKAIEKKEVDELSVKNESLLKENEELKAKIAELETHVDDNKDVEDADSKEVEQTDTKEVSAEDEKATVVQDEKKVSASKSKK